MVNVTGTTILTVVFEGVGALLEQEVHLKRGCFFLPTPEPDPAPAAELILHLEAPGGARAELKVQVVQLTPGRAMALAFADLALARAALLPWFEAARGTPDAPRRAPRVFWGRSDAPTPLGAGASVDVDEKNEGPLYDRIQAMGTQQRMQLALHGDRTERLILMKDKVKTVQAFVLKNPRITMDEVRYLAGYRQASPDVLASIGGNSDWNQNPGIVTALVRNPKTPTTVAIKLLERLPVAEVQRLAKSNDVPRAVCLAARKRVTGG